MNLDLLLQLQTAGLPLPVTEYAFAKDIGRRWRLDYFWMEQKVALEVDGAVYTQGRHTRGQGYERDCEKAAAAVLQGIRLFRASTRQVRDGTALGWLQQALQREQ